MDGGRVGSGAFEKFLEKFVCGVGTWPSTWR
jgi:hypothetical protein